MPSGMVYASYGLSFKLQWFGSIYATKLQMVEKKLFLDGMVFH